MGAEALGGLLSSVSSSMSGIGNAIGTNAANEVNFQQAADARTYNTQMSDTAYQRSVADMTAAGLNPLMMYQSGGGPESSPTSPTATMQNTMGQMSSTAGQVGDQILKSQLGQKQADNMDSQRSQIDQQTALLSAQTDLNRTNADTAQQTQQAKIDAYNAESKIAQDNSTATAAEARARIAEAQYNENKAGLNNSMATFDAYANRAEQAIGSVGGIMSGVNSGASTYRLMNGPNNSYNPNTTGTFNLESGEIDPSLGGD